MNISEGQKLIKLKASELKIIKSSANLDKCIAHMADEYKKSTQLFIQYSSPDFLVMCLLKQLLKL